MGISVNNWLPIMGQVIPKARKAGVYDPFDPFGPPGARAASMGSYPIPGLGAMAATMGSYAPMPAMAAGPVGSGGGRGGGGGGDGGGGMRGFGGAVTGGHGALPALPGRIGYRGSLENVNPGMGTLGEFDAMNAGRDLPMWARGGDEMSGLDEGVGVDADMSAEGLYGTSDEARLRRRAVQMGSAKDYLDSLLNGTSSLV